MKTQNLRRLFLLSAAAGLMASQSVMAYPFQDLDPAPDPDLLALTKEDEVTVQHQFDQFDLTAEERAQLTRLIDPSAPGVIEDFDLSRDPEAPIPMKEHPEYIELMARISKMLPREIVDCGPSGEGLELDGGYYYYLTGDISCTLAHHHDAGLFVNSFSILDLRGHTVTSTNHKGRGVQLSQDTVLFGGEHRGLISGFEVGIYSETNSNLVLHVESSNNVQNPNDLSFTGHGVLFHTTFKHADSHEFYGHRILYSVMNDNAVVGVQFEALGHTNASGDISIYSNHVYGTVANNNAEAGVLFLFTNGVVTYDHVDIFKNSISHTHVENSNDVGIEFGVEGFATSDSFSIRQNNISHSSVRCQSTLACGEAGIIFSVGEVGNSGNIAEVVDNSIYANLVDDSSGYGILFEVVGVEQTSTQGNINVSSNQIVFNNVSHNLEGIDLVIDFLETDGNINIKDNLVAFNRAAYSNGDPNSDLGNGIFVEILNLIECGSGSVQVAGNLIFANAVYQNSGTGVAFEATASPSKTCLIESIPAATSDKSLSSHAWIFNNNEIFFNQASSNGAIGLLLEFQAEAPDQIEAKNNRIGFNRVMDSVIGVEFILDVISLSAMDNSAKAIHNQADHNIVLDSEQIGILFSVEAVNGSGALSDISYKNRVRRNLVVESIEGILFEDVISQGFKNDSEKNGVFRNLVVDATDGILLGEVLDSVVRRNFVAKSGLDGIFVEGLGNVLSKNISILSGQYNFVDGAGISDPALCNIWKDNLYYGRQADKVHPPICFESKL